MLGMASTFTHPDQPMWFLMLCTSCRTRYTRLVVHIMQRMLCMSNRTGSVSCGQSAAYGLHLVSSCALCLQPVSICIAPDAKNLQCWSCATCSIHTAPHAFVAVVQLVCNLQYMRCNACKGLAVQHVQLAAVYALPAA